MSHFTSRWMLFALPCLLLSSVVMSAQDVGETVLKRGHISEDLYLAGGRVDVLAEVNGDVIAAGGRVAIDSQVTGDVLAAGGSVTVHGSVNDDARLAGGEVIVNATVGDGVVAAGGNVLLAPGAKIGGDVMLSGGRVEIAGQVQGNVRMAGGQLLISGQIDGNVELTGRSIAIKPDAVIHGNLTYRSPEVADIDPQARIEGSVSHIKTTMPGAAEIAGGLAVAGVLLWVSIALTGIVLYLLFPQTTLFAARGAAANPWKAMGLGLALFAATPVLSVMLFATGLGWLLAWLLITAYTMLLLLGFLLGVLLLSDAAMHRFRHGHEASKFANSVAFIIMLLLIMLIALIPLLGWLVVFLFLLLGIGGIALQLYAIRRVEAV